MKVSLPAGMASLVLRQENTRPMSRSVGLMASWLVVVSRLPSANTSCQGEGMVLVGAQHSPGDTEAWRGVEGMDAGSRRILVPCW